MRYILAAISIVCLLWARSYAAEDGRILEEQVLEAADMDIEKYRKSDAVIKVVDQNGRPVSGAVVHVQQITSDFLFAANVTIITGDLGGTIAIEHYRNQPRFTEQAQEEEFKRRFAELFNCATLPLYWRPLEPNDGKPDYHAADKVLKWLKSENITVKGHTLVWTNPDNVPQWFVALSPEEQRQRLEKHVRDTVTRYAGMIDMWDVVNEAAWANNTLAGMTMHDYTALPFKWARESDPDAVLCINDAHKIVPLSEMQRFWDILVDLNNTNTPYDVIGIQAHVDRVDRFPLEIVLELLKKYSELGKPIHVTEFTPCSDKLPIEKSWKKGVWTEEEQAEYAERFYRVCFSVPAIESIGWWDLTDYSAWQPGGGLLRADLTPKPAYKALKKLIHKTWRTKASGETDQDGLFEFRGFHGEYSIQIEHPSAGMLSGNIHIQKTANNIFEFVLQI
jgi:endo-1,4-beta-xylanase